MLLSWTKLDKSTHHRYVWPYNQQLPQSALGSTKPFQAMKNRHKLKPNPFKKLPYSPIPLWVKDWLFSYAHARLTEDLSD
jgi:hypothetical protein